MNSSDEVKKFQDKFLEKVADEYCFSREKRDVFIYRFHPNKKLRENQELAEDVYRDKESVDRGQSFQYHLNEICKDLEKNGCQIRNLSQKGRPRKGESPWEQAFKWLWETKFLEWRSQWGADTKHWGEAVDVEVSSHFYVERVPSEAQCYEAILQPGSLIRIKASQQMGKTLLLNRILTQARKENYRTVTISFELPDNTVFNDMQIFSQRFCALVGKQLELPDKLADYWKNDIFCNNDNTTDYFEDYLLAEFTNPTILALDKVDRVFEHPAIANDFCSLLRGWYDIAKRSDRRGTIWKKLRLVVVHSTDIYGKLDINRSPLTGVGLSIRLLDFNLEQMQDLAQRHGLVWMSNQEVEQLMATVGGHPYLAQLAFEYLKTQKVTLEELLQIASTEASPFSEHLREHLRYLKRYPEIEAAFRKAVMTNQPVKLESDAMFKLESMGLIQIQNDGYCTVKYNLYRQYFSTRLTAT